MLNHIKNLLRGQVSRKDVWYYIQGNTRQFLYDKASFLLRKHIKEQYEFRKKVANKECKENFECKECGCAIPQLFFANKPCKGNCYGKMKTKTNWNNFKNK